MRKIVIGMALASTALATPALAREDAWYVEVDGGAMIVEDFEIVDSLGAAGSLDTKTGFDFGGIVGYDFGAFRLETEASYRRAKNDVLDIIGETSGSVGGNSSALSFMLNGLLDFGPDDGLQGFAGGGVGVARVNEIGRAHV